MLLLKHFIKDLITFLFPLHLFSRNSCFISLCVFSCCGAGTAADTEKTTDLLSSNLTIFSMTSGRNPRLVMAVNILQDMLYRYIMMEVNVNFFI